MFGPNYTDALGPYLVTDITAVTLAATNKALYPAGSFPAGIGANFFNRFSGASLSIEMFGRITTALTPGNLTLTALWGSGADNTGTAIVTSAAQALTASQTNLSWRLRLLIHSRTLGSSGTLFGTGILMFNEAVVAPHMLIPASAPAASAAVDLTSATNVVSVQALRSGSTAETMQVHELKVSALN